VFYGALSLGMIGILNLSVFKYLVSYTFETQRYVVSEPVVKTTATPVE